MQYELRQQVIEPRRNTFTNLVQRYGDKPASRYQEGTIDVQPTEHFHYRPLWDPAHDLYDASFSKVRLSDPYAFTDPRQYYYAPYVTSRAQLHDAFAKTQDYIDERGLIDRMPESWQGMISDVLLPLRHFESGAQLITINGARFAYGTTLDQCLSYAAFDRIGNAQLIGRIGIALGGGTDEMLAKAKQLWLEAQHQQGLRRIVEELLVEPDWADAVVALDLVDQLLYPLLYRHLDEAAVTSGGGAYSLFAQHLSNWFTDNRRWLDALYGCWLQDAEYGRSNQAVLTSVVERRFAQTVTAISDLAAAVDAHIAAGAVDTVNKAARMLQDSLSERGISVLEENA